MRETEFFYWLQGYFELTGASAAVSTAQALVISSHCDLVFVASGGRALGERFVALVGLVKSVVLVGGSDAITAEIRRLVHETFEHVIDPQAGGDAAKLQAIHDHGRVRPPGEPVYRC
jgi:hypothetical protein